MELEDIIQELDRRFDLPLREYYERRIIFWQDPKGEFREEIGVDAPEGPWRELGQVRMPSGKVITATSDERRCHRNSTQTSATTRNSSPSLVVRLRMARSISALRS